MPAFHPNRPTRIELMLWEGSPGLGRKTGTRFTTPRIAGGWAAASPSKNESGMASTRPRPKSGVVTLPTLRTVACGGSTSTGGQHNVGLLGLHIPRLAAGRLGLLNGPTVNSW